MYSASWNTLQSHAAQVSTVIRHHRQCITTWTIFLASSKSAVVRRTLLAIAIATCRLIQCEYGYCCVYYVNAFKPQRFTKNGDTFQ